MSEKAPKEQADEALYEERDYQKALSIAEKGLEDEPDDIGWLKRRADAYRGLGDQYAEQELQDRLKVLEILPDDDSGKWMEAEDVARTYEKLGQLEKVIEYHEKAIELLQSPQPHLLVQKYIEIGEVCERMGDDKRTIEFYDKAVEIEREGGGYQSALRKRLELHEKQGAVDAVLEDYELLIDLVDDTDELDVQNKLAKFYNRKLDDPDKAIEHYTVVIDRVSPDKLSTNDPFGPGAHALEAYKERATILFQQKNDFKAALNDLNTYISVIDDESSPHYGRGYTIRALVLLNLGREQDALRDLNSALKLNEYDTVALRYRAMVRRTVVEDYQGAIDDASNAIEFGDKSAEVYLERGLAYVGLDQLQSASKDLSRALTKNPNLPEARYYYALVLVETGEVDKAKRNLERVINETSDTNIRDEAQKILNQLLSPATSTSPSNKPTQSKSIVLRMLSGIFGVFKNLLRRYIRYLDR